MAIKTKAQQESPDLYLSTAEGYWSVIYQGSPLCAHTTYDKAAQVYERTMQQLRRALVSIMPVWDGDLGKFR